MNEEEYALSCARVLAELIEQMDPTTVLAFVMEPVGGFSTGAAFAPASYYAEIRRICSRYGVLLVYDEVLCGAGRTGRFLAAHHWPDAQPDMLVLAKGLSAGYFPLGAVVVPSRMATAVAESGGFVVGHTFKTNPLGCAVGHAVLEEILANHLLQNCAARGAELRAALSELADDCPIIGQVRGLGLLNAIEVVTDRKTKAGFPASFNPVGRIGELCRNHGLSVYTRRTANGSFGDWLLVSPPLIVSSDQIQELVCCLGSGLQAFTDECAKKGLLR
jgi:adenosylmethionine-8-amino-7-oxononanoate aminotransferase